MIANICIIIVALVLVFYLFTKYYIKIVKNKINLQIWEMLNEVFSVNIDDVRTFNINNTKQTLVLLQVVLQALGDTMQFFKTEYQVNETELSSTCLEFVLQRCQDLDIEVDQNSEDFVKTIILNYIKSHEAGIIE